MWKRINALFNWLPLAALIEGKILCMHGGIGRCINRIEQIAELERPITMEVSAGGGAQVACDRAASRVVAVVVAAGLSRRLLTPLSWAVAGT